MEKSTTVGALILGASIGAALIKYYNMNKEDKDALKNHLKSTTDYLLDNAESTVEKVEQFMEEIKTKGENQWVEKLYVVKKMFRDLYGFENRYIS